MRIKNKTWTGAAFRIFLKNRSSHHSLLPFSLPGQTWPQNNNNPFLVDNKSVRLQFHCSSSSFPSWILSLKFHTFRIGSWIAAVATAPGPELSCCADEWTPAIRIGFPFGNRQTIITNRILRQRGDSSSGHGLWIAPPTDVGADRIVHGNRPARIDPVQVPRIREELLLLLRLPLTVKITSYHSIKSHHFQLKLSLGTGSHRKDVEWEWVWQFFLLRFKWD